MKLIKFKPRLRKEKINIKDELIEVRDLREKFYMVDDAYLNGYARICGIYATGVYNVLCRHVGSDQSCFPSIQLMADKLGVSSRQVSRAIKMLEGCGIIRVERLKGGHSKYWLIDKSGWADKAALVRFGIGLMRRATKKEKSKVKVTYE